MIAATESEFAVIGAALCYRDEAAEAYERLAQTHFSEPALGRVWSFIRERRGDTDPVLVDQAFAHDTAFQDLGGIGFLAEVIDRATLWSLTAHIDAIVDAAMRRELAELGKEVSQRASSDVGLGEALLGDIERSAADIARSLAARPQAKPVGLTAISMLDTAYAGGFAGSMVGLEALDKVTGGIRHDDVWFIAGRTSMGKSVVAVNLAQGIARQGRGVIMFSLEMPEREVQARLIADAAYDVRLPYNSAEGGNVRYGDILKGRGTPSQQARARASAASLSALPMVVNDRGGLTIEDIRSQALRQVRSWEKSGVKPGAIFIDHIGLVRAHTKRGDSKAAETADIVNELKTLAKQVGAPVIALCQVNRATESRNDKRPTLSDLNWSGAIEQIADTIILLYREAYYLERSANIEDQNRVGDAMYDLEILVAKNRSGPICNLKVFVDVSCNAVRDLAGGHERVYG